MEDFVTYEIAKKLEAKGMGNNGNYGYNDKGEICVPVYNLDDDQVKAMCPCPQIHEVLKWLRDEKKLFVDIGMAYNKYYVGICKTDEFDEFMGRQVIEHVFGMPNNTYEKAALAGIEYVIDNLI